MITLVLKKYKAITKAIRTKPLEKESLQSQKKKYDNLSDQLTEIRFIRSYMPRWDRDSMPPCFMNLSVI